MQPITIIQGLPFVEVEIYANNRMLKLRRVLLDTGASASVFKTDDLEQINILQDINDIVQKMTGIGGDEYVVEKTVDKVNIGNLSLSPMIIQMGQWIMECK